MARPIEDILAEPERRWIGSEGADEATIARLVAASPVPFPEALLRLLRYSNGGEGDLALAPRTFVLDSVDEIIAGFDDAFLKAEFAGFVFFGGDGGMETIALDCRGQGPPFPVVAVDQIAGPSSAQQLAANASEFIDAIGLRTSEDDG